jgi:HrpA-like RNA helicase
MRPDLKVVLMSATGRNDVFMAHFAGFSPELVDLPAQKKSISEHYLQCDAVDWVDTAAQVVCHILHDGDLLASIDSTDGDILVFCATEAHIHQLFDTLNDHLDVAMLNVNLHKLYRAQDMAEQERVMADEYVDPVDGKVTTEPTATNVRRRKVIISTNVAETSLTFPHLDFLVDCGERNVSRYLAEDGSVEMLRVPYSKSSMTQRKGRVGRMRPGYYIGLFTEVYCNVNIPDHDEEAPITLCDLSPILLNFLNTLPGGLVRDFRSLVSWHDNYRATLTRPARPSSEQMYRAAACLDVLGFVKDGPNGIALTEDGKLAAELGLSPPLARMFLDAATSDYPHTVLVLIAVIERVSH